MALGSSRPQPKRVPTRQRGIHLRLGSNSLPNRPLTSTFKTTKLRWQRRLFSLLTLISFIYLIRGILRATSLGPTIRRLRNYYTKLNRVQLPPCRVGRAVDETPISAHHTYAPDGLLHVNVNGIHPVLELIKKAEDEWERKADTASETLEEAVNEYKWRYNRNPPAGFDDWWDFAREMEVQLPDEYDSIHALLEPFWGIDPADLAKIQTIQETRLDTYTLVKNETHDTHLEVTAFSDPENWEQKRLLRGMEEIIALLDSVEPALRPFRAVFSPYNTPSLLSDYHVKKACLDAAEARQYVDLSKLPKPQSLGFASACSPDSPAQSKAKPPTSQAKTFIYNHRLSMDPCQHPHLLHQHSQYLIPPPNAEPIPALQFSPTTTPLFHDIPIPSFVGSQAEGSKAEGQGPSPDPTVEWHNKTDSRLYWRGPNTGLPYTPHTPWMHAQRTRLVSWAHNHSGITTLLLPVPAEDEGWQRVGGGTWVRTALLNPTVMDVAFEGKPQGCDVQYCRHLEDEFDFRSLGEKGIREQTTGRHKYIIDVDGKGPSTDFKRLLASNSLIFKATAYPEWWLDKIQPWVHYIPIQSNYADLHDALIFFRGGLYGEDAHDELAQKIASAGKEWSRNFWREEDGTVYLFRLLLEYARVMSPDREKMFYNGTRV